MSFGYFSYPMPANEPVLQYAPGSAERGALKKALAELKNEPIDIPMHIGGKAVTTGNKVALHPPHEISHTLGYFNAGEEKHVTQKAMEGIFYQIGLEEQKIRRDPVARTTELLKKVFGSQLAQGS